MIVPTIGRVVLVFRPSSGSDQYESAQIQYVYPPTTPPTTKWYIDAAGVDRTGNAFALQHIELRQGAEGDAHPGHEPNPGPAFACWMPYQRQAARGHQPDPFAGRSF